MVLYLLTFTISLVLYLALPLAIRFVILRRPIKQRWAAVCILIPLFVGFSVLINVQRDIGLKNLSYEYGLPHKPRPHMLGSLSLYLAMFASYYILRCKREEDNNHDSHHIEMSGDNPVETSSHFSLRENLVIIKCQSCGQAMSKRAERCPKCGTNNVTELPKKKCLICRHLISAKSSVCPECGDPAPFGGNNVNQPKSNSPKVIDEEVRLDRIRKAGVAKHADQREKEATKRAAEVEKVAAAVREEMEKRDSLIPKKSACMEQIQKLEKQIEQSSNIYEMGALRKKINQMKNEWI